MGGRNKYTCVAAGRVLQIFAGHMEHTATPVAPRPAAPRRKPGSTTLLRLLPERSLEGSFLCRLPTSTTRASQGPT
jgi:hypothetical protein